LDYGEVEEKDRAKEWQVHIVVNIGEAIVLFVRQGHYQIFVNLLLKCPDILRGVLK
jgi:hypothetical protein